MTKYLIEYNKRGSTYIHDLDGYKLTYKEAREVVKKLGFIYPEPAHVYVMHSQKTGLYKIGYTRHAPTKRLREVRGAEKDNTVSLINSFQYRSERAARGIEKYFHNILAHYRKEGEWFDLPARYVRVLTNSELELWWEPNESGLLYDFCPNWLIHERRSGTVTLELLEHWYSEGYRLHHIIRNRYATANEEMDEELTRWVDMLEQHSNEVKEEIAQIKRLQPEQDAA